jgi:hypothetical protein
MRYSSSCRSRFDSDSTWRTSFAGISSSDANAFACTSTGTVPSADVEFRGMKLSFLSIRTAASSLARLVCDGDTQGYRFLDARRSVAGSETIVVQVHVDRPQRFVHALKAVETIALHFAGGERAPLVLALRDDFPDVPHTNPGHRSDPVSLCIDDRPWDEAKLNWTPSDFLVRIQVWLGKTARGELHGDGPHDVAGGTMPGQSEFPGAALDRVNDPVGDVPMNVEAFSLHGGFPLLAGRAIAALWGKRDRDP